MKNSLIILSVFALGILAGSDKRVASALHDTK